MPSFGELLVITGASVSLRPPVGDTTFAHWIVRIAKTIIAKIGDNIFLIKFTILLIFVGKFTNLSHLMLITEKMARLVVIKNMPLTLQMINFL